MFKKTVHHLRHLVSILMVTMLLSSCSIFDEIFSTDNAEPPTQLSDFNQTDKLNKKWTLDIGKGNDGTYTKLIPAVLDGSALFVIDKKGLLSKLETKTGKVIWKKDFDMVISGGLSIHRDSVFFSNDKAQLIAVSTEDGKEQWRKQLKSLALSKVAVNDAVIICRTTDGNVYGLNRKNGEQLWVYDGDVPALTYFGTSAPVLDPYGIVFVGLDNGKVVALEIQSGYVLWQVRISDPQGRTDLERMVDIDGDPVLINGNLFVVNINGNISAIVTDKGQIAWRKKIDSFTGLAFDRSRLFVSDASDTVYAISQQNGSVLWKQNALKYRKLTRPVILENKLLLADAEGFVHLLSLEDGSLLGRIKLDGSGYSSDIVVNEFDAYLYANDGEITAIQVE